MDFNSLLPLPAGGSSGGSALLLVLALKGGVVLAAAGLISLALRRASAAARHLVWLLALLGVLGLPLLSLVVPPLSLPHTAVSAGPRTAPVLYHVPAAAPRPDAPVTPAPAPIDWPAVLASAWGVVALGGLARLGLGLLLARRMLQTCVPVSDPVVLAAMGGLAEAAGLRRRVRLHQGTRVAVPMTIGLRRPVVLLPDDAAAWPPDRLQAALRHELAHVRRRDWAWNVLAGVACALHWFNPLAWLAAHRLRVESERACDDAVLLAGTQPTDYAGHLLEIARRLAAPGAARPGTAVAMAQRPQIEGRLRSILSAGSDRRGLTRRGLLVALAVAVLALLPVAALRTAARAQSRNPGQDGRRADALRMTSLSNLRQIGLALVIYAQAHNGRLPDADRWVDEIGPNLSGGDARALRLLMRDPAAPPSQPYGYAFNRSLSGANVATLEDPSRVVMVFESTLGRRNAADTGGSVPRPGRHQGGTHYVFADGRARWVPDGEQVSFAATTAPPAKATQGPLGTAVLSGRVVYEDGRPAGGVRVGAQMQDRAGTKLWVASEGKTLLPNGAAFPLPPGAARPTPEQAAKLQWSDAITGPDGAYRLAGLTDAPYNVAVVPLDLKAVGDTSPWVAAAVEGAQAAEGRTTALPDLVLTAGGIVTGRVTNAAGKPVAGVFVGSYGPHRPESSAMIINARTDSDGRYRLRVAPGRSRVYIAQEEWKARDATLDVSKGQTRTADFVVSPQKPAHRAAPPVPAGAARPKPKTQEQAAVLRQHPAGPDMGAGRNIKMAGRTLDVMYDALGSRMLHEAEECQRLHMSKPERARRIDAVHAAGQAEINRVLASGYTASGYDVRFNPDFTVTY